MFWCWYRYATTTRRRNLDTYCLVAASPSHLSCFGVELVLLVLSVALVGLQHQMLVLVHEGETKSRSNQISIY